VLARSVSVDVIRNSARRTLHGFADRRNAGKQSSEGCVSCIRSTGPRTVRARFVSPKLSCACSTHAFTAHTHNNTKSGIEVKKPSAYPSFHLASVAVQVGVPGLAVG